MNKPLYYVGCDEVFHKKYEPIPKVFLRYSEACAYVEYLFPEWKAIRDDSVSENFVFITEYVMPEEYVMRYVGFFPLEGDLCKLFVERSKKYINHNLKRRYI